MRFHRRRVVETEFFQSSGLIDGEVLNEHIAIRHYPAYDYRRYNDDPPGKIGFFRTSDQQGRYSEPQTRNDCDAQH